MKNLKHLVGIVLRLGIGLAILAFLIKRINVQNLLGELACAGQHWPWLCLGLLLLFAALWTCIIRWKIVLTAQNFTLSWSRTFAIFFVGHFFNTFMPGGTGGDLIKAYYTARETHQRKAEAVASIFIDRTTGLLALITIVLTALVVRHEFFLSHTITRWAGAVAGIVCLGAAALLVLLFGKHLFEEGKRLTKLKTHPRWGRWVTMLSEAYDGFYTCRQQPMVLLQTYLLSITNHLLIAGSAFCAARSLELSLPYIDFITLVPIISMAGSIPITPGGLGLREGASIQLFAILGVPAGKAFLVMDLPYFGMLAWGLMGGLIFIFYVSSAGRPHPEQDISSN